MFKRFALRPRPPLTGSEPTTPDPIEIAMEAEASGALPPPDSPARRVLIKHEQLLGWQIYKERAGFGLRVMTGILGLVIAAFAGSLIWSATQERGLVIEAFSVPPEFTERGITGQVVASRLLDELSAMSDATDSVRDPSTYANNWNGDIKVQIPQTGISVGELRRYLVAWLGHQTTIGGEIYHGADGLVLSARTGAAAAKPQRGASAAELDTMIKAAAEDVYAVTQPYRYAVYVKEHGGENGEARSKAALQRLSQTGDDADRMWAFAALNLQAQDEGNLAAAIRASNQAIAIDPTFTLGYANRGGAQGGAGHAEQNYRDTLKAARLAERYGRRHLRPEGRAFVAAAFRAGAALRLGDYTGAIRDLEIALISRPSDRSSLSEILDARLALHQPGLVREQFEQQQAAVGQPASAPDTAALQMGLATEAGDWPAVARHFDSLAAAVSGQVPAGRWLSNFAPIGATAKARGGDIRGARSVIAPAAVDCYPCAIARATIEEAAGDHRAADRLFRHAVGLAPSLPAASEEWGRALLARRDTNGAIAQFTEASRRGPRWADPLKGWGDALMLRNDPRGAIRKYAAAAHLAPRWGALHLAWGDALSRKGDTPEARLKWRDAASMDLSPANRAEVNRRLAQ